MAKKLFATAACFRRAAAQTALARRRVVALGRNPRVKRPKRWSSLTAKRVGLAASPDAGGASFCRANPRHLLAARGPRPLTKRQARAYFSVAPIQRSMTQPSGTGPLGSSPGFFWWPWIIRRYCCWFPRRGSVWPAVRAGILRRNGRLRFDIRPAVANCTGRDCCPADLRLVAAACMSLAPSYAAARPATGHSFRGLEGMLHGTGTPPAAEPVTIARRRGVLMLEP
jgi:hypothetical protein